MEAVANTPFSLITTKFYIKTKKHIQKFGTIREEFFLKSIWEESKSLFYWYCQLQWIYLAARELGKLDIYNELKTKYTENIIPNF